VLEKKVNRKRNAESLMSVLVEIQLLIKDLIYLIDPGANDDQKYD
jgi:hypothetical protein